MFFISYRNCFAETKKFSFFMLLKLFAFLTFFFELAAQLPSFLFFQNSVYFSQVLKLGHFPERYFQLLFEHCNLQIVTSWKVLLNCQNQKVVFFLTSNPRFSQLFITKYVLTWSSRKVRRQFIEWWVRPMHLISSNFISVIIFLSHFNYSI